jgi:hypothetical protein
VLLAMKLQSKTKNQWNYLVKTTPELAQSILELKTTMQKNELFNNGQKVEWILRTIGQPDYIAGL